MRDLVLLIRAAAFAAEKLRSQCLTDQPFALAEILAGEWGVTDPVILSAALLHDTVGNSKSAFDEVEREFGPEIADILAELSNDASLQEETSLMLQDATAGSESKQARLIRMAGRIANLRDAAARTPASRAPRQDYLDWTNEVAGHLQATRAMLDELFDRQAAGTPI